MAKSSKFSRRQRKLAGRSVSSRTRYRMPKMPRSVDALPPEVEFRLRCVEYALETSTAAAVDVFHRSRATIGRWKRAYRTHGIQGLFPKSRRPKRTRKQQWNAELEAAVLRLRTEHRGAGKAKIAALLAKEGTTTSASTVGRILASLKRRILLVEPRFRIRTRKPVVRPYATRVPKEKRKPETPGALLQIDTVHIRPPAGPERRQFTAIDVVSRYAVLGVRSRATALTAAAFLDDVQARMPFPVQAIQVDGGSEFMAEFEQACQQRGIALYVLPPRSPKLNGRVERLNGTCRREFWEWYDGPLDLSDLTSALREYEVFYNHKRLHQALGYRTPASNLARSYVSN
ncbi:MAG: integrase core domain-containing protein [Thermomicrobiales bacterium]|nr:integrase core domain-containing protein [Thermomicrobiales bacterium]MCO5219940.1 integrase core domain-containing protein [Thermomicrobiales bacterium]MCO5226564.1 integrase core domain-containing protein [Thermomicrobiales bacterium]